jgi:hypothetical protein
MEYVIRDDNGQLVDTGTFKADPNGCFTLTLETQTPGKVEIRVKGEAGDLSDCCTVEILSENDLVNLPRSLNPEKVADKANGQLEPTGTP